MKASLSYTHINTHPRNKSKLFISCVAVIYLLINFNIFVLFPPLGAGNVEDERLQWGPYVDLDHRAVHG